MSKATNIKVADIPVSKRGRSVQLDSEMVADLKKILAGRVQAYNLAGYFEGKDLSDSKVRQAVGQNVRKHWTNENGVNADSKALRIDFAEGIVAARLRTAKVVAEATADAEASA